MLAIVDNSVSGNVYGENAALVLRGKELEDSRLICGGVHVECIVARPDHHVLDRRVAHVDAASVHTHCEISHVVGGDRWVGDEYGTVCVRSVAQRRGYDVEVGQCEAVKSVQSCISGSAFGGE